MDFSTPHPDFKWQGKALNRKELIDLAKAYQAEDETYLKEIGLFFEAWLDDNPLIQIQTSGSTGAPKKMWVKKAYMINSAQATQDFFNLPAKTTALLCLPATYIAGKLMLVRAFILGWEIDSIKPQANPLSTTTKNYDFTAITPYQLEKSLSKIHRVKKLMVGGGKVPQALFEKIQEVPTEIFETYAMTETLTHIAARRINGIGNSPKPPFQLLKNITIERNEEGCLIIYAPKLNDETIYTHDLVKLTSSTSFYLLGRKDTVINSGGIKLNPEKIESKLSPFIANRFFVYGEPDELLGESLVLIIEGSLSHTARTQLQEKLKTATSLGKYERPKKIYVLPHFTETHSGKIQREATYKSLIH